VPLVDGRAGRIRPDSGSADFVNNNPGAFADAYFEFNWVKVYQ
jgi:hypothetical protein